MVLYCRLPTPGGITTTRRMVTIAVVIPSRYLKTILRDSKRKHLPGIVTIKAGIKMSVKIGLENYFKENE